MATYLKPDNREARMLITWVQASPSLWRAFLAPDQFLTEVKQLLESGLRGNARRGG